MLIRFEVSNFRSIADPAVLSMVAIDTDHDAARPQSRMNESLLTRAGIYGPNASGKSSILAALHWVRTAVKDSLRRWDDAIPVEPHAFGDWPKHHTSFVLDIALNGVRYEYQLELDAERVDYEALFEYPEHRRRRVFERDGNDLILQTGLGKLSGARTLLTDHTLALSAMRRFGDSKVGPFVSAILEIQDLGLPANRRRSIVGLPRPAMQTERLFDHDSGPTLFDYEDGELDARPSREKALALLRLADLGVSDVAFIEEPLQMRDGSTRIRRTAQLLHRVGEDEIPLDFNQESHGTSRWFDLIGPVLRALQDGSLVVIDEIDAGLHPVLTAELLRLFRDSSTNPAGAQLLFTSHDTSLLEHLNRDEVWLTEKRSDGSTRLGPLAEFAGERVRRSKNLADAYLSGRFGALPDTDRIELLQALGLLGR